MPNNWCLWTVVLEKTPESSWNARKSNQSLLRGINPEYLLEGLILKLTLQYFVHDMNSCLIGKVWCWERLRVEGEEGVRGWDGWMALLINGHELEQTSGDGEGQEGLVCYSLRGCKELETTRQLNCNNNKFPTYKSSNFKLSKMRMCVHKFSHIS